MTPLHEQNRKDLPELELNADLDLAGNDSRIRGSVVDAT
jgi:hypothetical protein